jgi:hypothetical protein
MPGDDSLFREVLRDRRAVGCLLARGLVEQDHARQVLLDVGRGEEEVAVRAARLFRALDADRFEALLASAARFIGGENALAVRDHGGRGFGKQCFVHGLVKIGAELRVYRRMQGLSPRF